MAVSLTLPTVGGDRNVWGTENNTALTALQTAFNNSLMFNVRDYGAIGDGSTNDTVAILNTVAQVDSTKGGVVYFPPGVYLCNTVASGVILNILNKSQITLAGAGKSSVLLTNSATATDFLRLETCVRATVRDLFLQVSGTANITNALHVTTSDPGSAHQTKLDNVTIYNQNRTYRFVYDAATTSGSAVVTSATAVFAGGDVNGAVGVNQTSGPLNATVSSVSTITGTVSNGGSALTAVQTTVPLAAPLSGVPNSQYTIKIDSEIMVVTGGFQTSTLTVSRAYGSTSGVAATHVDGSTVTTYQATLSATATASKSPTTLVVQSPSSAVMVNGISLGADHPGSSAVDLASVNLTACTVNGANGSAFQAGNGTAGNVLGNYANGIEAGLSLYGVFLNGGGLGIRGGNFSTNGVDVKVGQVCSQPIAVQSLRTENCGMLYENALGVTAAVPISLRDVAVTTFYAPDGVPARHTGNASLTVDTAVIQYWSQGKTVQFAIVGSSASQPCEVVGINVTTNGGNASIWPTSSTVRVMGDALITLQANATSSSITNPITGQKLDITWIQDATGGRTYVWPTNCKFGGCACGHDRQQTLDAFRYDGTNWNEKSRAVVVG
jgi:hypothetical protein